MGLLNYLQISAGYGNLKIKKPTMEETTMIYHHDQELGRHHHAGRRTAGEILAHAERQNFDVSVRVSAGWNDDYIKRYTVFLMKKGGKPMLVALDSTSPATKEAVVKESLTSKELHEKAGEIAREFYTDLLRKTLRDNGFRGE